MVCHTDSVVVSTTHEFPFLGKTSVLVCNFQAWLMDWWWKYRLSLCIISVWVKEETVNLFLNFTVLSEFSYVDTAVGTEKMLLSRRKQNLFLVDLWKNRLDGKVLFFCFCLLFRRKVDGMCIWLFLMRFHLLVGCIYTSCPSVLAVIFSKTKKNPWPDHITVNSKCVINTKWNFLILVDSQYLSICLDWLAKHSM